MSFIVYVLILFFMILLYYFPENESILRNKYSRKFVYLGTIFISVYIVLATDINYIDRARYNNRFQYISEHSILQSIDQLGYEPLFVIAVKFFSFFTDDPIIFYLLLHLLFLFILLKGLNFIFNKEYCLLVFLIFLSYPFFYGYTLNGLRQSFALALIILSIGYMMKNYNKRFLITTFLAILFHYGTIPFSIVLIAIKYIKAIRVSFLLKFYFVLSILFLFNLQPIFFSSINIGMFESYFSQESIDNFGGSNRIQFYIFNTIFLVLFLYFLKKFRKDYLYHSLLKVYIAFSSVFLLFGFISYSNRVASYSWFVIPLICGYIILNFKNNVLRFITILFIMIIGLLVSFPYHVIN